MTKSCDNCTKCCEGFLQATIRGHEVGGWEGTDVHNPKPCPFVIKDKGCKQYLLRPKDPCKTFKCEWLTNEDFPEEMSPNKSHYITVSKLTPNGIPYIALTDAGQQLDSRVLSWHVKYALSKNLNLSWRINGVVDYVGHNNFIDEMNHMNSHNKK